MIGFKNSRHFLNQSEVKPKSIATCSRAFSRASCRLHVFAWSFDWFTGLSVSFVIGQSDYFGFGFTTLILKLLYIKHERQCFIRISKISEIQSVWIADETLSRVFDISSRSKQKLRSKRRNNIVKIYAN